MEGLGIVCIKTLPTNKCSNTNGLKGIKFYFGDSWDSFSKRLKIKNNK